MEMILKEEALDRWSAIRAGWRSRDCCPAAAGGQHPCDQGRSGVSDARFDPADHRSPRRVCWPPTAQEPASRSSVRAAA